MSNIVFEIFRAAILLFLLIFLVREKKRWSAPSHKGFGLIIAGMGLILFGSIIGITNNLESLSRFIIFRDASTLFFLENAVGYTGGFLLLTIGLAELGREPHYQSVFQDLEIEINNPGNSL